MSSIYQNKKLYCLLAIVFLFATNMAIGQGNYNSTSWRFSNPKQFGFSILDVDYFDNNNVIAVGTDGGIAKSTDGGTNWTYGVFSCNNPAGMPFKPSFNDVHFVTASVAYAVGTNGVMAKTTDGGLTWTWVSTPLFVSAKVLNACWFLDANKGYIGGQNNNTLDSFPKMYVTLNGGSTWDSIAAPAVNGVSRVGYISNVNVPSVLWPVNAKLKEIYRIEFTSTGVGYIAGTSNSSNYFPAVSPSANATTCLPNPTGSLTSSGSAAALLWKFQNGVLTDYSISKERLGYSGINTNTVVCTTSFAAAAITPVNQGYKAMNIINDSVVVLMSFNNNTVVRVRTGVNDFTPNLNNSNALEKGKYETLNFPFPPNQGPQAGGPIPPVQVLVASNPSHMVRTSNGTLIAGSTNSTFAVTPGYLWVSTDTGRNWVQRSVGPQGRNWTPYAGAIGLDIAPNGKILAMGNNGVVADSTSGGTWQSNHTTLIPGGASFNDMEFTDCSNGITAGGATIVVTSDGGATWVDKTNGGLAGLNANITSVTYPQLNKVYFTTSIGTIYRSINQGTNLTPVFVDQYGGTSLINDLALAGNDSIWACGVQQSNPVPALLRFGLVYRSFNNGATWDTIKVGPLGNVGTQAQQFVTFRGIEFPSRNIGYACGNRGAVYKTIDAGATWTNISPFPAINISPAGFANSAVAYTDILALDNNTVFVVGNMFTSVNNRRIYKTTDGGANWVDISSNIDLLGGGNLNAILMHDANNGYVVTPGGVLFKTTNGGVLWTLDLAPSGTIFATMAFAPKTVPAGISMQNRKLFVCGANVSGAPIMEYGNPANVNVNSTELINGSCSAGANGSIVITATGGIAPYTYSLDGSPYQSSNTFNVIGSGNHIVRVKDAYCGLLTKTVVVPVKPAPTASAGPDKIIVDGDEVTLDGSGTTTSTTIAWTPNATLTGANTFTPVAKPRVTTNYTMTVTDNNGCVSTDNTVITVIPYCVKPMNAFTPNGDGINDRWLVTTNSGVCVKQVIAKVFNRYGELIYSNDFYNNDWDGKYKGKAVADGTYYYVIQFKLINGNSIPMKGDVTILR